MAAFTAPLFSTTFLTNPPSSSTSRHPRFAMPTTPRPVSTRPRTQAVAEPVSPTTTTTTTTTTPSSKPTPSFDSVVMNTYTRYPLTLSHGSGCSLYSVEGREYLDFVAGIATCTLGHAHPSVIAAVTSQMRRVTHVSNLYYIPEQRSLASWLVSHSPMDKVFFCNSGGEANEAAIKLARKNWHLRNPQANQAGRVPVIITAKGSFHGRTIATLTATGQPKYHQNWWPLVQGFDYVTYNDAAELEALAEKHGDCLAAIMLEAIQGEGGIHRGSSQFFRAARSICDRTGALLICDEVQVGVGRTGKMWGFEHTDVTPDVFTTAKGLGGGVPIGAMCCTNTCDVFAPGDHASTFGGNPLACAAGLAVANELEGGVLRNAEERGRQLGEALAAFVGKWGVKEVRGVGLIRGVEGDWAAGEVVQEAMQLGLLLVPAGKNVVRLVPPLIVDEAQVERAVRLLAQALEAVAQA